MLVKNRDKYVKNWLGYEGFKFDKKTFSIFLNSFFFEQTALVTICSISFETLEALSLCYWVVLGSMQNLTLLMLYCFLVGVEFIRLWLSWGLIIKIKVFPYRIHINNSCSPVWNVTDKKTHLFMKCWWCQTGSYVSIYGFYWYFTIFVQYTTVSRWQLNKYSKELYYNPNWVPI